MSGSILNVSTYGMVVEVSAPIAVDTPVGIAVADYNFRGEGKVLWCQTYGKWYRIGIHSERALLFYIDIRHALLSAASETV